MKEYSQILNTNEKVLWEGQPQLAPFFARSLFIMPFGFVFFGFAVFWTMTATSIPDDAGPASFFPLFGIPFILIGLGMLLSPVYYLLVYRHTHYVITDKRVLLQGGLIGRDYEIVDFDKIQSADVKVGLADKLFGQNSGSIAIHAGRFRASNQGTDSQPYTLSSITDPYKAFQFLKQVSFDVKSDLEFPNAMRPDTNPGYNTDYDTKKKP